MWGLAGQRRNRDTSRPNSADEARDEFAVINEDRELRAPVGQLAACAYWKVAGYRALKDVKGEDPSASFS